MCCFNCGRCGCSNNNGCGSNAFWNGYRQGYQAGYTAGYNGWAYGTNGNSGCGCGCTTTANDCGTSQNCSC